MTHVKALTSLAVTIIGAGVYIALAMALGVREYWAGFLFLCQWGLMEQAKVDRLLASVTGAFTGLILAGLLIYLPRVMGPAPGFIVAILLILAAVYALTMGWLPIAINGAAMIFLTVATIPHIAQATGRTADLFIGLAFGAAFFGGLVVVASLFSKRREGPVASARATPVTAASQVAAP